MFKTISQAKTEKLLEALYLLLFSVFMVFMFSYYVAIPYTRNPYIELTWTFAMLLFLFLKSNLLSSYRGRELALALVLAVICIISWQVSEVRWVLYYMLLVLGAKDVSFEKLVRLHFGLLFIMILGSMLACYMGIFENRQVLVYVYETDSNIVRNSFGLSYPTTFSEFVFFCSLSYCYLRREKITFIELAVLVGIAALLQIYCYTRTDALCMILMAFFFLLIKLNRRFQFFQKKWVHRFLHVFPFVMPLSAGLMIVITYFYTEASPFFVSINEKLNNRPMLGRHGLDIYYCWNLFGNKVIYQADLNKEGYFNLDSSYVQLLVNYGVAMLCLICFIYLIASFKAIRMNDPALLFAIVLMSIECIMENRIIHTQFNIFCLIPFAVIYNGTATYRIFRTEKPTSVT